MADGSPEARKAGLHFLQRRHDLRPLSRGLGHRVHHGQIVLKQRLELRFHGFNFELREIYHGGAGVGSHEQASFNGD